VKAKVEHCTKLIQVDPTLHAPGLMGLQGGVPEWPFNAWNSAAKGG